MDSDRFTRALSQLGVSASQACEAFRQMGLLYRDIPVDTEQQDKKLNNKFFTTKKDERNLSKHKATCQKAKRKRKKR